MKLNLEKFKKRKELILWKLNVLIALIVGKIKKAELLDVDIFGSLIPHLVKERIKNPLFTFNYAGPGAVDAPGIYYTIPLRNLSREKCEKFCTNYFPEFCAFWLL